MSDLPPAPEHWRNEIRRRLEPLGLPPIRETEIVEEIAQHLDDRYRELRALGHEHEAAADMAWRELREVDALGREIARVETRAPLDLPPAGAPVRAGWVRALWHDVRYAARTLARAPTFTLTVVFAVALSIGPTTAILSIGNWLLWRPHPGVTDSGRLAEVWVGRWSGPTSLSPTWLTYDDLAEISRRSTTIAGIAGGQESSASLSVHGLLPRTAGTAQVTANFFEVLGARMRAGRAFLPEEDRLPGAPVAIVSHALAASAFGTPEAAVGKTLSLNSRPFTVVGVAASDFGGTSPMAAVDVWVPGAIYYYLNHWSRTPEPPVFYSFVVRIAPDAAASAVETELNGLIRSLTAIDPERKERLDGVATRVFPGLGVHPLMRASTGRSVRTMLLVGAVLLLIGCANVANLLVLRISRRGHEIGVRKALGATAVRLIQVQLMEACLLATAGAALGLGLAVLLKELMQTLMFPEPPGIAFVVPLDWRVLTATITAAIGTGLIAAAGPAWLAARGAVMRPGPAAGSRTSARAPSLRGALAALQLALSLTLLVGALLLVTTLRNLRAIDLGFDHAGITVLDVDLQAHGYTPERQLFGLGDPIGQTVRIPANRVNPALDLPVIGLARDSHWDNVTGAAEPFLYYPLGRYRHFGRGTFIVKSALPAPRVGEIAGEIAARIDRDVPFRHPRALMDDIDSQLSDERLFAWVLSLLAALGFLLASLGLYGLVAQTVAERAREFGIRVALGARRGDIIQLVARYALVVSSAGILMGLGLSFSGTRLLQGMLHGVTRLDPVFYGAAAVALIAAVALACVAPVLRALRVQPVDVLRAE
jgi:ABC-type antimicrobial peptide transport system permease subunit